MNQTMRVTTSNRSSRPLSSNATAAYSRDCNLCGHEFHTHERYRVFCNRCKNESEIYRFSEWMPTSGASLGVSSEGDRVA